MMILQPLGVLKNRLKDAESNFESFKNEDAPHLKKEAQKFKKEKRKLSAMINFRVTLVSIVF